MKRYHSWTLTDINHDLWVDSFATSGEQLSLPGDWTIRKRSLHGGLRDGVEVVDVSNGALHFSVLPTRGMGLWRGAFRGLPLGWRAPVQGPVHPKFVQASDRGGIG